MHFQNWEILFLKLVVVVFFVVFFFVFFFFFSHQNWELYLLFGIGIDPFIGPIYIGRKIPVDKLSTRRAASQSVSLG